MWLLVVFFSLTQDKFDIVPVCALARVSFTYLHTTMTLKFIPHPPMKFLATPLAIASFITQAETQLDEVSRGGTICPA